MLYSFSNSFKIQSKLVFNRYETIQLLYKRDITAGGTSVRLTSRSDKVMKVFKESPIFGKGISSIAFSVNDTHVGNQNMLMEGGVIGFLINMYVWASITLITVRLHFSQMRNPHYNRELLIIVIMLLGLLIIHSSSSGIIGYLVLSHHPFKIIFIPIVLGIINCILIDYKSEFKSLNIY